MRTPFVLVMLMAIGSAHAQVIYVDSNATPGGDGSGWGRAFDSLHDAIAAASSGQQIWVAEGIYVPSIPAGRDATFAVPAGVQIYGGFLGGETSLSQRDPQDNITELSGAGSAYTVVTITGNGAIVDGFLISKGRSDGNGFPGNSRGAGVYADGVFATLRNNTFTSHFSSADGAAITIRNTAPQFFTIEDCEFVGNESVWTVASDSDLTMLRCRFVDNLAGAVDLDGTSVHTLTDCVFIRNEGITTVRVDTDPGSFTLIDRCLFEDNVTTQAGGVWYSNQGVHEIRSSIFNGNQAQLPGGGSGGVRAEMSTPTSELRVDNSLFAGNSSPQGAALNKVGDGNLTIVNTTMVGNSVAAAIGGAMSLIGGDVDINNSIVFDNITNGGINNDLRASIFVSSTGSVTVSADRSIIQFLGQGLSPINSTNSTNADPMLVDPDGNDNNFGTPDDNPRPGPGSPAIDAGNNDYVGLVSQDVFGQTRIVDDTGTPDTGNDSGIGVVVDIGALEFQGTTPSDCVADTNGDGVLTPADFNGWIIAFNNQSPACDQNGDGACTPADFNAWIINFNNGC